MRKKIKTREELNLLYLEGLEKLETALFNHQIAANPEITQAIIELNLPIVAVYYVFCNKIYDNPELADICRQNHHARSLFNIFIRDKMK